MAHNIVKLIEGEDGIIDNPKWCLEIRKCGDAAIFCSGLFYVDEMVDQYNPYGTVKEFEVSTTDHHSISCPECLEMIKNIQSVKI
ncbi:MAG: hypothetical protein AAFO03_08145 [Bacteroidota bacterium]